MNSPSQRCLETRIHETRRVCIDKYLGNRIVAQQGRKDIAPIRQNERETKPVGGEICNDSVYQFPYRLEVDIHDSSNSEVPSNVDPRLLGVRIERELTRQDITNMETRRVGSTIPHVDLASPELTKLTGPIDNCDTRIHNRLIRNPVDINEDA